jgi:predicted metal-dependent hydrolase
MNKYQKLVQQQFINDEEKVIKRLETVYNKSYEDITKKIADLDSSISTLKKIHDSIGDDELGDLAAAYFSKKTNITPEEAKETLKSQIQSKVYQKKYQAALRKQVDKVLDKMLDQEFKTVADYIEQCYENGFVGTMFDLQGQGIPLCFPLDQEAMVRAVQLDSKISQGLYSKLGEDVAVLKKKITAQVSRGISTGMTFQQVAQQLAGNTKIGYNNAVRIARTEGHRVQVQSAMDACYKAKDKGADVVKQWDSTLDSRTRESHTIVDGEIRELDEKFSNGLMFPGDPAGGAAEVINCRCALLQRAKWALDEEELEELKKRAQYYGLDKSDSFEDFKKKYLKAAEQQKVNNSEKIKTQKDDIIKPNMDDENMKVLDEYLKRTGVEYRKVEMHDVPLSEEEIISVLSGGDLTRGSCASLGLAYMGQKGGMNVLDFRDGESRSFFSSDHWLQKIAKLPNAKTALESAKSSITSGNRLLKLVESGKEYYFVSGRHAAIVRKTSDGVLQYLELQSAIRSGWHNFNGNPRATLASRFGEIRSTHGFGCDSYMIDVDSLKDSDDLRYLLGYINTSEDKQRKGKHGTIK